MIILVILFALGLFVLIPGLFGAGSDMIAYGLGMMAPGIICFVFSFVKDVFGSGSARYSKPKKLSDDQIRKMADDIGMTDLVRDIKNRIDD